MIHNLCFSDGLKHHIICSWPFLLWFLVAFRNFAELKLIEIHLFLLFLYSAWKGTHLTEACRDSHNWQLALGHSAAKNPRKVVFFGVSKFESAEILLEMLHLSRKQEKTETFKPGRNAQLISGKGKSFSHARCEVVMRIFLTFQMALAIFTSLRAVSKPRWSLRMFAEWFTKKQRFEVRFAFRCPRYTKSLWQRWGWLTKHVDQLKTTMVKPPRLWVGGISRSKKMVMISSKVCNQVQRCFPTFQRTEKERIPSPKALEEIFAFKFIFIFKFTCIFTGLSIHTYLKIYVEIQIFLFPSLYSQLSIHSRRSATSDIVKCVFKRFRKIQMLSSNWAIKNAMCFFCLHIPGSKMSHPK